MIKSNLFWYMRANNLNIEKLCKEVKISRNTLSGIMNGKNKMMRFDVLEKLCNRFKVGVGELLEIVPDKNKPDIF